MQRCRRPKNKRFPLLLLPRDLLLVVIETLLEDARFGIVATVALRIAARVVDAMMIGRFKETRLMLALSHEAHYRWTLNDFLSIEDERVYSGVFHTPFGHQFRLICFPRGNKTNTHVSAYLEVPERHRLPKHWARTVDIEFRVHFNSADGDALRKTTSIVFDATRRDWGYREFVPVEDLDLVLVDGELQICISVTVAQEIDNTHVLFKRLVWRQLLEQRRRQVVSIVAPRARRDLLMARSARPESVPCEACGGVLLDVVADEARAGATTRGSHVFLSCGGAACPRVHVVAGHRDLFRFFREEDETYSRCWPSALALDLPEHLTVQSCVSDSIALHNFISADCERMREALSQKLLTLVREQVRTNGH